VEGLEQRGIGFRSVTEAIDTTTPGGRLVFTIFGALAEFKRSITRERTLAGLQAARARGRVGGRPLALGPDDIVAARSLLANSEISVRDVAERIGCSPATLYRYLPAAKAKARERHEATTS
jgi:DNA invertase Pin-like site-specific DNA recombinase